MGLFLHNPLATGSNVYLTIDQDSSFAVPATASADPDADLFYVTDSVLSGAGLGNSHTTPQLYSGAFKIGDYTARDSSDQIVGVFDNFLWDPIAHKQITDVDLVNATVASQTNVSVVQQNANS